MLNQDVTVVPKLIRLRVVCRSFMHCQLIRAYVMSEYLKLLAAMQDRVSANNIAMRTVAVLHLK